jgi:predicted nucleic acid-binding protein
MIVLDANILIRAILGRRVRQLLETYAAQRFRFVALDVAFDDAQKYLPPLLEKRSKSDADIAKGLEYLKQIVEPIDRELYEEFEKESRERLRDRDEDDWPVLAIALGMDCDVWSEDQDFFGTGVAVWTTNRIEILLRSQQATKPG